MISAKEALELYNNSLYTLQRYLEDNFHSGIRQAAMDGKKQYFHCIDCCSSTLPKMSDLEYKVVGELQKLGYKVNYTFYGDKYVPRGLADDDGNGPEHQNYGILVSW